MRSISIGPILAKIDKISYIRSCKKTRLGFGTKIYFWNWKCPVCCLAFGSNMMTTIKIKDDHVWATSRSGNMLGYFLGVSEVRCVKLIDSQ